MLYHRGEVAIVVQQCMAVLDAERADDDVGRLPDRDAQLSQFSIVPRRARGEIGIQKWHDNVVPQSTLDARGMRVITGALKNLKQDQVPDQERLPAGGSLQFGCPVQ